MKKMKKSRLRKTNLWKIQSKSVLAEYDLNYTLIYYYHLVYNATFSIAPKGFEKEYKNFIKKVKNVMDNLTKTDMINKVPEKELLLKYGYTSIDEVNKNHKYSRFITKKFYKAVTTPILNVQYLTDKASHEIISPEEKALRRIVVYKVKYISEEKGLKLQITWNENQWFKPVNIKNIETNDYIVFDRFEPLKPVEIYTNNKDAQLAANIMREKLIKKIKSSINLNQDFPINKENKVYENVDAACLKKIFGIKNIKFKSNISNGSRENILNNFYEAFEDLVTVLKIKANKVSFNNKLKIAIDIGVPKFQGVYACAVADPNKTSISFNLEAGGGNLAHEWFHLLDYNLGVLFKMDNYPSMSNNLNKVMPELYNLIETIKYKANGEKTNFYKQSLFMDESEYVRWKDDSYYWSSNVEMLARTFAKFISDSLKKNSDLLVKRRENNIIEPSFTKEEKIRVYKKMRIFIKRCKELKII